MNRYYIGLMSGTSADGIDLALVDFSHNKPVLVASFYQAYDATIQAKITSLYQCSTDEIELMGALDIELAHHFAKAINAFLSEQNISPSDIAAIGNHGQTIRHRPPAKNQLFPFTLQIGCCDTLAALTSIRVIGQFRRKDIAYGGQGAPLVPAFHRALLSDNDPLFIVNIGGIANITYLPNNDKEQVLGFDTGPGNALMDDWYQQHHQDKHYDENGHWAKKGKVCDGLLNHFLSEQFFTLSAPKSTGREYFNQYWLSEKLSTYPVINTLKKEDIQATLNALTAITITRQIKQINPSGKVYMCGGGVQNKTLIEHIKQELSNHNVQLSDSIGVSADSLEAMAFAWFAYAFDKNIFGNIPSVTGASKALVLGTEFNT